MQGRLQKKPFHSIPQANKIHKTIICKSLSKGILKINSCFAHVIRVWITTGIHMELPLAGVMSRQQWVRCDWDVEIWSSAPREPRRRLLIPPPLWFPSAAFPLYTACHTEDHGHPPWGEVSLKCRRMTCYHRDRDEQILKTNEDS